MPINNTLNTIPHPVYSCLEKETFSEGRNVYIFSTQKNGEFYDFIFGAVTGIDGRKVGINGVTC